MTPAVETFVKARAGLGDLPARLRAGPCTIAYMGASVTAQRDGYRPRLHALLVRSTGQAHRAVPAAIGATGTITGAFVMDELATRHRPDIAFVEYATSDVAGTTPPELVAPALEGIVSKLRDAGCEPCFLYLYRRDLDLSASEAVAAYEAVADRHGVPSLDVAARLRAEIADGTVEERALLRDLVHTTPEGSQLTAEAIHAGLDAIPSGPRPPRVPSADGRFHGARLVSPDPGVVSGGPFAEGRFRLVYPYRELEEGAEARVSVDGRLAGLLVILGPHSGFLEVTVGSTAREYLMWDEDCDYERLGSLILSPFAPRAEEVALRVSGRPVDTTRARRPVDPAEASPKRLRLAGLMVLP